MKNDIVKLQELADRGDVSVSRQHLLRGVDIPFLTRKNGFAEYARFLFFMLLRRYFVFFLGFLTSANLLVYSFQSLLVNVK